MKKESILLHILLIGFLMVSCSGNGYQKTVETKKGISFSFEFPVSYQDPSPEWKDDWSVNLFREVNTDNIMDTDTEFSIQIIGHVTDDTDAKTELDHLMSSYSQLPSEYEFELLERSKVEISGIDGELIAYYFRYSLPGGILASHISTVRSVYLDYIGKIWMIEIISHPEVSELAKQEFEHIIESFSFLD